MSGRPCLSESACATLGAVVDRLIPADEHGPGAVEAGVVRYIDSSLAGELSALLASYEANLAALDALAAERRGRLFAELGHEDRDTLLAELESGGASGFEPSAATFFELVRTHAIQGMFGDPSHGGNVGFAGWDLLGFPGLKVVYTERDQALDVEVAPVRE
jgi:gluconate 2-dehydrogenase gamma chain